MKEEDKSQKRAGGCPFPVSELWKKRVSFALSAGYPAGQCHEGIQRMDSRLSGIDGGFVCHRTGTEVKTLHSGTSQADSGGAGGTVRKWEISHLPFLYVSQHFHPRLAQM